MKPSCVYTLNELQTLVPSLRKEHLTSKDENIKKHIIKMFWHLGCDATEDIEIQEGVVCRNRFGNVDESARVIVITTSITQSINVIHNTNIFSVQFSKFTSVFRFNPNFI